MRAFHCFDRGAIIPREVFPGWTGRIFHTARATLVYWDAEEGALLPLHSHPHEQIVNMIEGRFRLDVNGSSELLEAGMTAVIPPNAEHSGEAITPCRILDVFVPARDDYRERFGGA